MPVEVCFHYDVEHTILGVVVRDDREDPRTTLVELQDGRFVTSQECIYSPLLAPLCNWQEARSKAVKQLHEKLSQVVPESPQK